LLKVAFAQVLLALVAGEVSIWFGTKEAKESKLGKKDILPDEGAIGQADFKIFYAYL
jgi:hypothetical protein